MIKKGWAEKLDKSAIPNIKNLSRRSSIPRWDPNREYSLPWQSGMTGIAYNDKLTIRCSRSTTCSRIRS